MSVLNQTPTFRTSALFRSTRLGSALSPLLVVAPMDESLQDLLPAQAHFFPSAWQPQHMADPPEPPPVDTREADLAALAAQEKLGHDGKRQRVRPRRTVDPFGGLERWKIVRRA